MRRISKQCWVYILTNQYHTVLYTGMTSNIQKRIYEHKNKLAKGFSAKYNAHKMVFCEAFHDPLTALIMERKIKGWTRKKKIALINSVNPNWKELLI